MASIRYSSVRDASLSLKLFVGSALDAQKGSHLNAHIFDQPDQRGAVRWGLQILDDCRSSPLLRINSKVLREVPQLGLW